MTLRNMLLAGVAGFAMTTFAGAASAQVQQPGFFGSLTGWYYPWKDTGDRLKVTDSAGSDSFKARPGDGFGGRAYLGYRFMGGWDIAVGAQATVLSKGKKGGPELLDGDGPEEGRQKADNWAGDLEFGYNGAQGGFGYRVFLGARVAEYDHRFRGEMDIGGEGPDPLRYNEDFFGVGPRVGASGSYRLGNGNFSLFGDFAAAYLFGSRKIDGTTNDGDDISQKKDKSNSFNVEGQLGVAYEIAPMVNIGVGYRAEYWSGVHWKRHDITVTNSFAGDGDRFTHGPFVRLSYNIGAPRGVMPAAAVAPAPAPAAAPKKNFLVFFDFDRSNITADAQKVITEAAAAAKAGNVSRIQLTGHTDRSGSDQYNMALSLRRGEAVKQALIRQGIPAASIAVIGRGESQPLVPTADGVREPQNRRVEIML